MNASPDRMTSPDLGGRERAGNDARPSGGDPADRPAPSSRERLSAAAVAAVLAVFFAPAFLSEQEFVYRDTGRMHAPMKRWIADELARGNFPAWNPYSGLGTPVIANGIDSVQHPFTLLLLVLPSALALKAWILLSFAAAAAGAFVWARVLGRSPAASAIAALAFTLSGPLVSTSDNVTYLTAYAALPWMFSAVHVFVRQGGPGRLFGVAVASFLCAAAGDPQAWGMAAALLLVYALAVAQPGGVRQALRRGGMALATASIAAAPILVPIAAWLPYSRRAGGLPASELARWNLHPHRLLELGIPELFRGGDPGLTVSPAFHAYCGNAVTTIPWFLSVYVGASVLALAGIGVWRERWARVLAAFMVLFLWAAMGPHAGFQQVVSRLPILGSFRYWEKLAAWIALLLALLAARGADAVLDRDRARWLPWASALAAVSSLGVALLASAAPEAFALQLGGHPVAAGVLTANVQRGAKHAGIVLSLVAVLGFAIGRQRMTRFAPLGLAAVVAMDLFGGNAGAYVLGPAQRTDAPPLATAAGEGARVASPFLGRDDRWPELGLVGSMWEWSRRSLVAAWNVPARVGTPHDYVGLRPSSWGRYIEGVGNGHNVAKVGLFGVSHLVVPRSPALASEAGIPPPHRVAGTDAEMPAYLVEMQHRPRAYIAERVVQREPDQAFAFALSGGVPGESVVEVPLPDAASPGRGEAHIARDAPGEVEIDVRTDGQALLVLNDLHAPGWRATVDGAPAEIVRTNALVRGVWVEQGRHRVRFCYRTPGLVLGWAVALAGAAALLLWSAIRRRRWGSPR